MKQRKKKIKILTCIICAIILLFGFCAKTAYADVGDFDTYDYDWGGSSWDYDSGSDYWYDDDYDSGFSTGFYLGAFPSSIFGIVVIVVIVAIIGVIKSSGNGTVKGTSYPVNNQNYDPEIPEAQILSAIKAKDPNFSKDDFLSMARVLFVKLQYAWSDRNWEIIRTFETTQLFDQHKGQLQRYIDNKQINKIERVSVSSVKLFDYKDEGEREVLSVLLSSKMIDYIMDEQTGKVLKGSKTEFRSHTYKLSFARKTGVKTNLGDSNVKTTNCPNCGAPTEITSAGKCSYCGSVITTGNFSWVLSNLEPYSGRPRPNGGNRNNYHGGNGSDYLAGMIVGGVTREVMRGLFRPPRGPRRRW